MCVHVCACVCTGPGTGVFLHYSLTLSFETGSLTGSARLTACGLQGICLSVDTAGFVGGGWALNSDPHAGLQVLYLLGSSAFWDLNLHGQHERYSEIKYVCFTKAFQIFKWISLSL